MNEQKPLWDWIKYAWKKYIYKPHIHNWTYLETKRLYSSFLMEREWDVLVYKCPCGRLLIPEVSSSDSE